MDSNGWLNRPGDLPETPTSVVAYFSGDPIPTFDPPAPTPVRLFDEQSDPARLIVGEFSLDGGMQWLPTNALVGPTANLQTRPSGYSHALKWDFTADGIMRADNVAFRFSIPWQAPTKVSTGLQRAAMAATSSSRSIFL